MVKLALGYIALLFVQLGFSADSPPACSDSNDHPCDYCLNQRDFEFGTYRAMKPGIYCIEEDILFNPMPGKSASPNNIDDDCWFPRDDTQYPGCLGNSHGAYALGYFAMITIEASDVTLDLNGYTLSYHRDHYLQQRWGSIIEISNSPFLPETGPADFGKNFTNVRNIVIRNGNLGLTSHHGIHANNAEKVLIENVNVHDFEVGGIQFNGFNDLTLRNLEIGPSLQNVPLSGYYSGARFLLMALQKIVKKIHENGLEMPSLSFAYMPSAQTMTLQQVYDNLHHSMDIAFRDAIGETTWEDKISPLYDISLKVFKNQAAYTKDIWTNFKNLFKKPADPLPDGSSLYGIVLNSFSVAVFGFGHSPNEGESHGEGVLIENVNINEIRLNVNDVPAVYFDACHGKETKTTQKGAFGELMNIRLMVSDEHRAMIEHYGQHNVDLSEIKYAGNPLSDAQIAFYLSKDLISDEFTSKSSFVSEHFLKWALNGHGSDNKWPECASFICNGDIMFHQNKGVIGLRMDQIENAEIKNVHISNLFNESPLAKFTCADYSGPHDGGHTVTVTDEREGAMLTDVRGIAICEGDVAVSGENSVQNLNSFHGDAIGIDLMMEAKIDFESSNSDIMKVDNIDAATKVTKREYRKLKKTGQTPYPNNFEECDIAIDDTSQVVNGPSSLHYDDCENVFEKKEGWGFVHAYEESYFNLIVTFIVVVFVFFCTRR